MLIEKILKEKFGFDSFKGNQKEIINSVILKNNTLGIMPTGGGKSLTYQISGLRLENTTLVISPLISLMEDQVNFLNKKGIKSAVYNSSLTLEEKRRVGESIKNRDLKFLFVAPERLFMFEDLHTNQNFLNFILNYLTISLIVIDEAHCISSWGHNFREDYLRLKELMVKLPGIPILSLTASADPITKEEIIQSFNIEKKHVHEMSIERKNLNYNITKKYSNGFLQINKIISKYKGQKGIIYCFKKTDVNKLTRELKLKNKSLNIAGFHADIKEDKKKKIVKDFIRGKIDIVIATIAFGMGIDRSDVRYIIHKELPKNIESYYQETGRAGRDGEYSDVWLLYSGRDYQILKWLSNSSNQKNLEQAKLLFMRSYVKTSMCKKQIFNWYFENISHKECKKCCFCKSKNNKKIINNDFIQFLNNLLLNKKESLFEILKQIENKFGKEIGENFLFQLIYNGYINYDRKEEKISLLLKLSENISLNEYKEIEDVFPVIIKKKSKVTPVKKKKEFSLKKNTVKKTSKPVKKTINKSIKKEKTTTSKIKKERKSSKPVKKTSSKIVKK